MVSVGNAVTLTMLTQTPPLPPVVPSVVPPVADVEEVVPPDADVDVVVPPEFDEVPVVEVPELPVVPLEVVVPPVAPVPAVLPDEDPPEPVEGLLFELLPASGPALSNVPPAFLPSALMSLGAPGLTSMVVICFLSSLVLPPTTSFAQLTIVATGKTDPTHCANSLFRPVLVQKRASVWANLMEILRSKVDSIQ